MTTDELKQTIATYENTALNLRERAAGQVKEADQVEAEVAKLKKELAKAEKAAKPA